VKRTLAIVGTPAIAALFLLAGGAPAASAGEQHHHHHHRQGHHSSRSATSVGKQAKAGRAHHHRHHKVKAAASSSCTVAPKCRPKPLPKPANGWPCAKTHSCATHHHYPICKPKPPVAHPVPPIVKPRPHTPTSHVGGHKKPVLLTASVVPEQLPRTGANVLVYVFAGGALALAGSAMRLAAGFKTGPKHRDLT
jgi:hypothetical protein